jgi:hypothetical protein
MWYFHPDWQALTGPTYSNMLYFGLHVVSSVNYWCLLLSDDEATPKWWWFDNSYRDPSAHHPECPVDTP